MKLNIKTLKSQMKKHGYNLEDWDIVRDGKTITVSNLNVGISMSEERKMHQDAEFAQQTNERRNVASGLTEGLAVIIGTTFEFESLMTLSSGTRTGGISIVTL